MEAGKECARFRLTLPRLLPGQTRRRVISPGVSGDLPFPWCGKSGVRFGRLVVGSVPFVRTHCPSTPSLHSFPFPHLTRGFSESFSHQFLVFWQGPRLKYTCVHFHMGPNACLPWYCITKMDPDVRTPSNASGQVGTDTLGRSCWHVLALGHAGCFYSCYYENFVSDKS